jgi:hypothetical protein
MKSYKYQIILSFLLLSINAQSQKIDKFAGKWCSIIDTDSNSCWDITIDKNQKKTKSTLTVFSNQLYYDCTNKLKGDTLFFNFENYDAGIGGGSLIGSGKIKIPTKGKLIGKAIIKSDKLFFIYKANNMYLKESYIRIKD